MFKLENIVRKNILSLKPYSSARDEFSGKKGVFLDANENPFGTLNRYPDPYQKELKNKLATLKQTTINNIFIGNGSDEVIDLAYRIFCNPGQDKALTFSPTYGMYNVSAAINNIELITIPLTEEFQIDINTVSSYLDDKNLKIIFICSPNNPTGNLISKNNVENILKNFNGIVIIDEAYIDFSNSESYIKMITQYPNLIVSQTFSKAWGLAAVRVGIAYANEKIIKIYNKVKPPYNVSGINQKAALDTLLNTDLFKKNIATIIQERQKLKTELEKLDLVIKIYPSDANFLLVEVKDANKIYTKLVHQKIIIRNRNNAVANCVRFSVGTPKENKLLLHALKKIKL